MTLVQQGIEVQPSSWSAATRHALTGAGLDEAMVAAVIGRALAEDFADGPDVTTAATVPPDALAQARITPRQAGVFAGGPVAMAVFDTVLQYTAPGGELTVDRIAE